MGRTTFWLLEQEQKAKKEQKLQEPEETQSELNKIDWEKEIEQYYTNGGWYKLPGYEKSMRKNEAIEVLKESDN